MKRVALEENWLDSWKSSYPYDLLEIYGEVQKNLGYAYGYQNRQKHTLNLIDNTLGGTGKILDVAAAQGNFSLLLAEKGYDVTWNDIREELIDYVKLKWEKGTLNFVPGNVFESEFNTKFDLVLATEIIEHVAHPDDFLLKLSNLITPKGFILISTPLGSYFRNNLPKFTEFANPEIFEDVQFKPNSDGHIFLLHISEMYYLAEKAGLEVVSVKYYTNPLTNGHLKLGKLLKILPRKTVFLLEELVQKLPHKVSEKIHTGFCVLLKRK